MVMTWIWCISVLLSVIYGVLSGNIQAVSSGVSEGASAAVSLCVSICGVTCLWTGVMEVMKQSGLAEKLSRLLFPVLRRIFPKSAENPAAMEAISANVSANLLGLGNAATPFGIQAVSAMAGKSGRASDELCRFVVLNTASLQLLPVTVAAVRAASGSAAPFDILPAVWCTSLVSVTAGLLAAAGFARLFKA